MDRVFLGGHWLSLAGRASGRALLVKSLELGFDGLVPCPSQHRAAWNDLALGLRDLPASIPAVRSHPPVDVGTDATRRIASRSHAERTRALDALAAQCALARAVRAPVVILEPGRVEMDGETEPSDLTDRSVSWDPARVGSLLARYVMRRDRHLDALARALHQFLAHDHEITMALTGSYDLMTLGEPGALRALFEDLHHPRLRYWHDTGIAFRREQAAGLPQGLWLEELNKWLCGATFADATGSDTLVPPGSGLADLAAAAAWLRRQRDGWPVVIELDPAVADGEVRAARSFLRGLGL